MRLRRFLGSCLRVCLGGSRNGCLLLRMRLRRLSLFFRLRELLLQLRAEPLQPLHFVFENQSLLLLARRGVAQRVQFVLYPLLLLCHRACRWTRTQPARRERS